MSPALRRPLARTVPSAIVVLALAVAMLGTVPRAALAAPPKVPDYPATIDAYARYDGQQTCSDVEQPGVRDFRALLRDAYGANGGGILRSCSPGGTSEHKEGRAYDWMLDARRANDAAKADEFLTWLLATDRHGNRHAMARRFGVMYVIWNGQVWKAYQADRGWQTYTGANPHTDHIHFSFSWDGALRKTTYWTMASGTSFPDVPAGSYYAAPVDWMVTHGITDGYGKTGEFRPHTGVSRAQMAAFLWRTMDSPTGAPHHGFPDVPAGSYYDEAVRWLRANGITDGYGETGRFEPHRVVTRGEMAAFLWRTVGVPLAAERHPFPDVGAKRYYDEAVSFLFEHAITDGYGTTGRYEPSSTVTRAQTAAFLHRLTRDVTAWREASYIPTTM